MSRDKVKQRIAQNNHYTKNKNAYLERTREKRRIRKEWFRSYLSNKKCAICPESCYSVLDFHHIIPNEKEENVSRLISHLRSFDLITSEIRKCVIICSNCHRKIHAGTLKYEFNENDRAIIDCEIPEEPRLKNK